MEEETKKFWTENKIFVTRLITWIIFALILPVCFIVFRFDIFHKSPHFALGFWGLFAVIIILTFVISSLRYICKAMPFSMATQIIGGVAKVILPLGLLLFAAYYIKMNLDAFIQALWVVLCSEAVAIPLNPMPKWIHEHLSEEQQKKIENIIDLGLDKFFARKNKGE